MKEYVFYIVAVALQLSGSIILLIGSFSTKRSKVICEFSKKGLIERDNDTNDIFYDKEAFCDEFYKPIINKSAFLLLSTGYLLSIFGHMERESRLLTSVYVIVLSIIIVGLSVCISRKIARNFSKEDITNKELTELNITPNLENISNKELDNMFDAW